MTDRNKVFDELLRDMWRDVGKELVPKAGFEMLSGQLSTTPVVSGEPTVSSMKITEDMLGMAIGIEDDDVEEFELFDQSEMPEERFVSFLNSMASVGIVSEKYYVTPRFSPHNRDFFLLPSLGEFVYEGETVEAFKFPQIGAEKFSKIAYQSVGVASPNGILATGVYTDVIDAAREKLDGTETIVYSIRTRSYKVSFMWSAFAHRKMDKYVKVGHYEQVGDKLYFLSGTNELGGIVHQWQYLTKELVEEVRGKDGLIVRMSGKEYRLPWNHTATLYVRDGVGRDSSNLLNVNAFVPNGLYDFVYHPADRTWSLGKKRNDKVRPDAHGGITEMLTHASTLGEFLDNVPVGKTRCYTPVVIRVVALSQDRKDKIKQSLQLTRLKVRVAGGYKKPDSYRRIILEDLGKRGKINTTSVCPRRLNVISSCGRVVLLKRHSKLEIFKIWGNYYTTSISFSRGRVRIVRLKSARDWTLNIGGPVVRVYEFDVDAFAKYWGKSNYKLIDSKMLSMKVDVEGWTAGAYLANVKLGNK